MPNKWPTLVQLQDINDSINLDEIDESSTSAAVKMTQVIVLLIRYPSICHVMAGTKEV